MRPHNLLPRLARLRRDHNTMPMVQTKHPRALVKAGSRPPQGVPPSRPVPHHGTRARQVGQMTNPRSTPQYQAWRSKVLTQCEPVCIRCGYPVDMTLKGSHPDGPSADHEPPLAITGEATPSLDGAGIAHLSCNRSHGGRLGSQRAQANAQAKRNGKPTTKTDNRSLSKALLNSINCLVLLLN